MAARLNPKQDDRARSAIMTTQLCKRLNAFALGDDDPCANKPIVCVMTDTQVRAALGLLKKTIPDLAVTAHTGPDGGAVTIEVVTGVPRIGGEEPEDDPDQYVRGAGFGENTPS